jgi:hypothetical protein
MVGMIGQEIASTSIAEVAVSPRVVPAELRRLPEILCD